MESNLFNQWVAAQIPEATHQQSISHNGVAQHEAARELDWSKDRTLQSPPVNGVSVQSPTLTTPSLDLNDFASLGDLSSELLIEFTSEPDRRADNFFSEPGTTAPLSPSVFLNPYLYQSLSPYNAIPYGAAWTTTPSHIPVSNYSSLNGATTAPASSQPGHSNNAQQTHRASPPIKATQMSSSPPAVIEWVSFIVSTYSVLMFFSPLLTVNSSSSSLQNAFQVTSAYAPSQSQPTISQNLPPQSQTGAPRSYYNSSLMYPASYYRPQAQTTQQGTLSPQALHSPGVPMIHHGMYTALSQTQTQPTLPSSYGASHTTTSTITPTAGETPSVSKAVSALSSASATGPTSDQIEERKRKFLNGLRPLLQPTAFTGAGAVQHLTDRIEEYGITEVDTQTRLDVLNRIRDGAGNPYYRAWSENSLSVEITREWLKAAAKSNSGTLQETLMPLLQVCKIQSTTAVPYNYKPTTIAH